jgi:hypothetical protein
MVVGAKLSIKGKTCDVTVSMEETKADKSTNALLNKLVDRLPKPTL